MINENASHPHKQNHTFDGPAEEFINEYDEAKQGVPPKAVPAPTPAVAQKKNVLTTLGKILSFLHR